MSNHGDSEYNNTHRAFLQALLAHQTITYEQAKPLLAAIQTAASPDRPTLPEDITREDFAGYVDALQNAISPFDLEIRSTVHQSNRERVYALVNTTSDALTQMATMHTVDEIAFVKRVLDAMFDTYNTPRAEIMAVTGMQALKLNKAASNASRRASGAPQSQGASSTGLTMSQAEKVLSRLVAEGWLELSPRGFYSLSPRALMELRGWLIDSYNEPVVNEEEDEGDDEVPHQKIKFCHACKDIATVGLRCPDLACNARLHNHCTGKMFRAQGGREQCPLCQVLWVNPLPVGEKAAREGGRRPARSGGGRGGTSRQEMESDSARDDDDSDSPSDEE